MDRGATRWFSPNDAWKVRITVHCEKTPQGVKAQLSDFHFEGVKGLNGTFGRPYITEIRSTRRGNKVDAGNMMGLTQIPETVRKYARARMNEMIRQLESL